MRNGSETNAKGIGEPTGWGRFLDRKDVPFVDTEGR